MKIERRSQTRYDIRAEVRVAKEEVIYDMKVENISRSGAFVSAADLKHHSWVTPGKELQIALFATEELDNIQLKGLIVRVAELNSPRAFGFGVAFTYAEPGARAKLHQLVDLAAQQSVHPPPQNR